MARRRRRRSVGGFRRRRRATAATVRTFSRRVRVAGGRRRVRRGIAIRFPRRRSVRRIFLSNPPDILGFNLKEIAVAGAAVVASPFVEKQLLRILPVSMAGTKTGRWAVKVGSAVAIGFAARRFMGSNTARLAMIGLGAQLVADAVTEFMPTFGVGFYPNRAMGAYAGGGYASLRGGRGQTYLGVSGRAGIPMNPANDPFRSQLAG